MKAYLSACFAALLLAALTACGGPSQGGSPASPSPAASGDDSFRWMNSTIAGLSDKGMEATELVIPASATEVVLDLTGNTTLQRLSFESDETVVRSLVLEDCTALEEVAFPASLEEIGDCSGCTALTRVTIPEGVVRIASSAFSGCTALESVALPDSVVEIGSFAFSDCTALKSVTLSAGLTQISDEAFYQCAALTQVVIPEGVTRVGVSAFDGCAALGSVSLPASLQTIEEAAFLSCTALTDVTIPEGVTYIAPTAFMKDEGDPVSFSVKGGSWADTNAGTYQVLGTVTTY